MTELHADKSICRGCKHRTVIFNEKCDGKIRTYCRLNTVPVADDCLEFKAWGVYA